MARAQTSSALPFSKPGVSPPATKTFIVASRPLWTHIHSLQRASVDLSEHGRLFQFRSDHRVGRYSPVILTMVRNNCVRCVRSAPSKPGFIHVTVLQSCTISC